jgi:nitrogenase-stabilizing/protective protein
MSTVQPGATAADRLLAFNRCQTAEEYFAVLDVPYDPQVVSVNRLHILRHFAGQLAELRLQPAAAGSPDRVLGSYRDALIRSYQAFTTATALDHRLFKVLRDRAPRAFVPATAITVQREEREQ